MSDTAVQPNAPIALPATPQHSKRHWLAWLLGLVLVGLLLLPLFLKKREKAPAGPPSGAGTSVSTELVRQGPIDVFLDALGTVTPLQTVNVYSQVSGRVMAVMYREGQMVQRGQALVEIDPRPVQAQLQQSLGSLVRDRAALEQARVDLKRYQDALAAHAIAQQTVFDEEATVRQAEGTVQNDQGLVDYYRVQLSYCHIVAPISGRIGLRLVDPGNTIFSGSSTTIATITQLNPITAVFSIAEDHMPQVEQQMAQQHAGLRVDLYDRTLENKINTGRLLTFDNQVDTSTGTVRLRAQFDNATNTLFPNQFVNARLEVHRFNDAELVSTSAVQYNGQQAFVYTVDAANKAHLQNVAVVTSEGSKSAITGIPVGTRLVTNNFDRIQDGATVTLAGAKPATVANTTTTPQAPGSTSSNTPNTGTSNGTGNTAGRAQ